MLVDGLTATSPAAYAATLGSLACTSGLSGIILDRLADNPAVPDMTTGIHDAAGVAKAGAPALATASRTHSAASSSALASRRPP